MSAVFISYRHEDDAHCARVRKFAERLEAAGLAVIFDAFAEERDFHGGAPTIGWPIWSTQTAANAPSVIAIASSGWFRILNEPGPIEEGKGAAAEAATIYQRLYRMGSHNTFLCIGFFDKARDLAELPTSLDGCGRFDLNDEARFTSLIKWLRRPLTSPTTVATDTGERGTTHFTGITRPDGTRVPLQLPPKAVKKFYGRGKESHDLERRLRDRDGTAVVGPAGYGKTALAAEAVIAVVGKTAESLAGSPYPDGVVFLDLYAYHGQAEPVWHELANTLRGPEFLQTSPARHRAEQACRERRVLVIIEGGEEADGKEGRVPLGELLGVLAPENRCLLLTRDIRQAHPATMIRLDKPLGDVDAGRLFDALTGKCVTGAARERILQLLAGHPLGLTWAGGLLARDDEDPSKLADDWEADPTRLLSDPMRSEHTLEWLFNRSEQGLDETARRSLRAAGLLARAPFPIEAIEAAVAVVVSVADAASVGSSANVASDAGSIGHVRQALKQLIDRGLLRRTGEDEQREFTHVLGYRFARNESSSDAGLRNGLAGWLHRRLSASLTVGANSTEGLADLLQHAAALLRTDHDQQLWQPLAFFLLYAGQARLVSLGRLDWVHAALGAVNDWFSSDRFPAKKAAESFWQRELAAVQSFIGNVHVTQGDLEKASTAHEHCRATLQRLAESDPANAAWQRDLSVSFNKLGDLATAQGNLPEAQRLFGESLRIRQRLAESDPANAAWQRDLSVSFNKLGELATAQGNLPEAQRLFGEWLRIAQRLAESDPANAAWQRDLWMSFGKLGDMATAQGDLDGSQRFWNNAHRITQRLAESDPANAAWQRDLSVSFEKLGELATAQGNLPEAQRLFGQALRIRQRLAESDPANAAWQRDLSVSFNKLGELATAQGNLPEAQRLFGQALRIRQRLAESDPANAEWQRDLSVSFNKLGELATAQGNLPEAQRLAESDPANAAWQRDLVVSHYKLAMFAQQSGDDAGYEAELRECFRVLDQMKQRDLYFDPSLAQVYQQLAGMFGLAGTE